MMLRFCQEFFFLQGCDRIIITFSLLERYLWIEQNFRFSLPIWSYLVLQGSNCMNLFSGESFSFRLRKKLIADQ